MLHRLLLLLAFLLVPAAATAQGIVSSADPRGSEAGREILRAGGSATDAAMAMMLALTVVEPQSSGIGGGGFLVHHDAGSGIVQTIDGREMAPSNARPDRFLGPEGRPRPFNEAYPGGLSVGVPGNIRLMAVAHARWGKLPWERLFEPAIRLADDGFAVSRTTARLLEQWAPLWAHFPDARRIYWRDGKPLAAGETMRNPALAETLRRIAKEGPDAFYSGKIADAISDAVDDAGVNEAELSEADIAAYRAKERPAVCTQYRRYKVCGMGPPSSGATTVLQILELVERFDLKAMGPRDPLSWHVIAEAMKLAYADRDAYLGDRDFVPVPSPG